MFFIFIAILYVGLDIYAFQAVKTIAADCGDTSRKLAYLLYWGISGLVYLSIILFFMLRGNMPRILGMSMLTLLVLNFLPKIFISLFMFIDDVIRLGKWLTLKWFSSPQAEAVADGISRSEFLAKAGLIVAALPLLTLGYGIASGAYNYTIKRRRVGIRGLPDQLEGLRIVQISDIHSGSFFDKKAVERGIDMINKLEADLVCFTGDLVNNTADEMDGYKDVFAKINAKHGVYSILGNHDYGDYVQWPSQKAKQENLNKVKKVHQEMGWDLLLNENRILDINGHKLGVVGVENWSAKSRFHTYGNLEKAYEGVEKADVKILLSHDPSHWDAEVRESYKDIALTMSGHTHGMQFGIEVGNFRWSPVKYMYDQWADLYTKEDQHLYVNRGFGFIGYPGRVGILPEITVLELQKT